MNGQTVKTSRFLWPSRSINNISAHPFAFLGTIIQVMKIRFGLLLCLSWLIVLPNIRLHKSVDLNAIPQDIDAQLAYLQAALATGRAEEMQGLFPEGYFFSYALYGLTWVDVGLMYPEGSSEREEALREARWAWQALASEKGQAPFQAMAEAELPFGMFYMAWRTDLLAGILLLQPEGQYNPAELEQFRQDCAVIAQALQGAATPFLASYPGMSWPVDAYPAIHALRAHRYLVNPQYEPLIEEWLAATVHRLDPATGLVPHRSQAKDGTPIGGARATSQTLILRFLADIEPKLGAQFYSLFRQSYLVFHTTGLPGVREYPQGVNGSGDIDSGPLLDGISLSATAVMMGTARMYNDQETAVAIEQAGEALAMPITWRGQKRYGFGLIPVGDAFAAWSQTVRPWFEEPSSVGYPRLIPRFWQGRLHLVSLLLLGFLWLVGLKRSQ